MRLGPRTTAALAVAALLLRPSAGAPAAAEPKTAEPLKLSLERCVELGIEHSIRFLSEKEDRILQELATALTRHNYGALWSGIISAEAQTGNETGEVATVSIARRLLTGGDLRLSASTAGWQLGEEDDAYTSDLSVSIEQPLLRGAGQLVAREDLTQAERDLVYAGRELVLFKQEFLIDIVRQYYQLVRQREQIGNQQEKAAGARWLRNRTQALEKRGLANPIDVLRAENNLLRAENDLNDARELYALQLDNLKLDLGLPVDREMELVETKLTFRAIPAELKPSVEAALANRLDLKTARDAVEDARRDLGIARNNLRGDLDLIARLGYTTEPGTSFGDQRLGDSEWSVGLAYEIPLDRVAEKTSYQQRLITYARAARAAGRVRDQVVLDVRKTVRDLRQAEATIVFQKKNVELAEMRLERARADFEIEKATTRDVEEAQDELLDAKNALDRATVDYIIAALQLQKDTGVLDFEKWRELIR